MRWKFQWKWPSTVYVLKICKLCFVTECSTRTEQKYFSSFSKFRPFVMLSIGKEPPVLNGPLKPDQYGTKNKSFQNIQSLSCLKLSSRAALAYLQVTVLVIYWNKWESSNRLCKFSFKINAVNLCPILMIITIVKWRSRPLLICKLPLLNKVEIAQTCEISRLTYFDTSVAYAIYFTHNESLSYDRIDTQNSLFLPVSEYSIFTNLHNPNAYLEVSFLNITKACTRPISTRLCFYASTLIHILWNASHRSHLYLACCKWL